MSEADKASQKVLRIGIIQGGKIIEERRMKKRESVTVGSAQGCSFTVASTQVPKQFTIFELSGNKHYLRWVEGMEGKIQLAGNGGTSDFKQIVAKGEAKKRDDVMAVELIDNTDAGACSRGKVTIGDVTVLFQFVDPPSAAPKVALPDEVKGGFLTTIDVQFSSIFTATSLAMMAIVAYAQSVPYVEPSTIEEMSERYQKLIMPTRVPEPPRDEKPSDDGKDKSKDKDAEKEKAKPEKAKSKSKAEDKPVDAEAEARARKEALQKKVAGKGLLGILGSKGREGAVNDVFNDSGFGEGKLGEAFSGIQGVDVADSAGKGTRGGGSGGSASIGDLKTSGGGSTTLGAKGEAEVRGNLQTEAPEVEGDLSADIVKKEMQKNVRALKDCYERQLKRFPTLAGKLTISFEILDSGKVGNVDFTEDSLKNADVKSCIKERARYWRFPKPNGGSVFVNFPLVFTPAG
ncbi:MAG: AgmX/PglI C-terminal domain-containing protein [Myxococcota bacterium]